MKKVNFKKILLTVIAVCGAVIGVKTQGLVNIPEVVISTATLIGGVSTVILSKTKNEGK